MAVNGQRAGGRQDVAYKVSSSFFFKVVFRKKYLICDNLKRAGLENLHIATHEVLVVKHTVFQIRQQ